VAAYGHFVIVVKPSQCHATMGAILLQNVGGQLGVKPIYSSRRCWCEVLSI